MNRLTCFLLVVLTIPGVQAQEKSELSMPDKIVDAIQQTQLLQQNESVITKESASSESGNTYLIPADPGLIHTINLDLNNSTSGTINGMNVRLKEIPKWVTVTDIRYPEQLANMESGVVQIEFKVNHPLKVETPESEKLVIGVFSESGLSWEKEIQLEMEKPSTFKLMNNYPNPFNPATSISYSLPERGYVQLEIFTLLGQKVETLVKESKPSGTHTIRWDANKMASGVYLYRIVVQSEAGRIIFSENKKMLLIK